METDIGITIAIGVGTLIISELVFHYVFTIEKLLHRHILAILITLLFSFAGISFKIILDTRTNTLTIERIMGVSSGSGIGGHFTSIVTAYHSDFVLVEHTLLEPWAEVAVGQLSDEMTSKSITLPALRARKKIHDVYESAHKHIFQTHIGSLDIYTKNDLYVRAIKKAVDRGIPVVLIFLVEGRRDSDIQGEKASFVGQNTESALELGFVPHNGQKLSEYSNRVRILHEQMGVLMSVVVPVEDSDQYERRELLVADEVFLSETMYHEGTTTPTGAVRATGDHKKVKGAYEYVEWLLSLSENLVHTLDSAEVRRQFSGYISTNEGDTQDSSESLAEMIARILVDWM